MSTRVRIALMVAAFVAGLALLVVLAFLSNARVKVNGPVYQGIARDKDLVADILPPPAYAIEAYLVAHEMDFASDREASRARIAELDKEFEASHAGWAQRTAPGELANALAEAHQSGRAFLDFLEREVVTGLLARRSVDKELQRADELYKTHRAAIDRLAALATKAVAVQEEEARAAVVRSTWQLVLAGLAVAAVVGFVGFAVGRRLRRSIAQVAAQLGQVSAAVDQGDLGHRAEVAAVDPEFRGLVEGINRTVDALVAPTRMMADHVDRIARGEIPAAVTGHYRGEFEATKDNLNRCIGAINALVADVGLLARAGVEGRLATRADASRHQGDFRKVIQGVNDTLDAVIGPLEVGGPVRRPDLQGQIPPRITDAYAGDFNAIKENLNRCVDAIGRLVSDASMLAQAGVEGRLATRADASRHEGDFRKVVDGVNGTLDAVIGPLEVAARYVDQLSKGQIPPKITDAYRGDFNTIKENLNTCIEAVNRLVADSRGLVEAAVSGQLSTRADASRHQGDFRRIVEGVNQTLDAMTAPVHEAAAVLEQLAQRDLRARMSGEYQGDHARIKESLNATGRGAARRAGPGRRGRASRCPRPRRRSQPRRRRWRAAPPSRPPR